MASKAELSGFRNPSFLIIGAQRCGTTSLFRSLMQHPRIRPPVKKEIHYFDDQYGLGLDWYRSHFPPVRLFEGLITGEASPYYLFHPLAPSRVAEVYPDMKLIVLLRNPVDRAWSHYHHNRRRGRESRSFEDALAMEARQLEGEEDRIVNEPGYRSDPHRHFSYTARGIYAPQIRRWLDCFPPDRFLFIPSEEYFKRYEKTLESVFDFLGVGKAPQIVEPGKADHGYDAMLPATREQLELYYRPFNRELGDMAGIGRAWDDNRNEPKEQGRRDT